MNIEQLAHEVWPGRVIETEQLRQELTRFATLAIAAEHKRLLEGSGEPYGIWHDGETEDESDFYLYAQSGDVACSDCIKLYTADQMAAAVAIERERCAKVCEEDAFVEQWKGLAEAAQRIRTRGVNE